LRNAPERIAPLISALGVAFFLEETPRCSLFGAQYRKLRRLRPDQLQRASISAAVTGVFISYLGLFVISSAARP